MKRVNLGLGEWAVLLPVIGEPAEKKAFFLEWLSMGASGVGSRNVK